LLDTATRDLARVTENASHQTRPSLRGHLVAYEDDRSGDIDVYATDLSTGTEFPIFVGPGDQHLLGLLADGVAWATAVNGSVRLFWNPAIRP
jgi:hypothetical protein